MDNHEIKSLETPLSMVRKLRIRRGDTSVFVPLGLSGKMLKFSTWEFRVVRMLGEMKSVEDISKETGRPESQVRALMGSKRFREWYSDRLQTMAIGMGWTPDKVILELEKVWEGKSQKTKGQLEAMRMMKDIVTNRIKRDAKPEERAPVININLQAAKEALERQKVIEAELVDERRKRTDQGSVQE